MKIAIIGAGIFGLCAALELKDHDVTVFERNSHILSEATSQNMLRHHMGYHYPRSDETVNEIKYATQSFEREFDKCVIRGFPAYYAVAKKDSLSSKEQVVAFFDRNKLPFEIVEPPDWLINKDMITLLVKTPEPVYDPIILAKLLEQKLAKTKIRVKLNHEVIDGKNKELVIKSDKIQKEPFDIIINATYSYFNTFNRWFGFDTSTLQYDLMEILEIKIPRPKFGLLILDGLFCTILPKGDQGTFTLGHVKHTMLKRLIAKEMEEIHKTRNCPTNREVILRESMRFMPFLKDAKVVRSLYSTRVIKANHEHDDARPTEITDYGDGLYSIFAGKVITAVKTAKELRRKIDESHISR